MKGQPGGPGRPEGSKNFSNLHIWLGQIWEDIEDVDEIERNAKRIEICKWAVGSILTKVGNLPATPGDSAQNGANLYNMMNAIAPINPPLESNPGANGGPPANGSNGA